MIGGIVEFKFRMPKYYRFIIRLPELSYSHLFPVIADFLSQKSKYESGLFDIINHLGQIPKIAEGDTMDLIAKLLSQNSRRDILDQFIGYAVYTRVSSCNDLLKIFMNVFRNRLGFLDVEHFELCKWFKLSDDGVLSWKKDQREVTHVIRWISCGIAYKIKQPDASIENWNHLFTQNSTLLVEVSQYIHLYVVQLEEMYNMDYTISGYFLLLLLIQKCLSFPGFSNVPTIRLPERSVVEIVLSFNLSYEIFCQTYTGSSKRRCGRFEF